MASQNEIDNDVWNSTSHAIRTISSSADTTTGASKVQGASAEVTALPVNTLNGDLVPQTDVSMYASLNLQITAMPASSTILFQVSNDGVTWANLSLLQSSASGNGTFGSSTTAAGFFAGSLYNAHYFRARMTVYGGVGSATGVARFITLYPGAQFTNISGQITSGNSTGSAVPSTVFPMGARDSSGLLQVVNEDAQRGLYTSVTAVPTVSTVPVATTSTAVLSANANRKSVIFSNVGANNIYLNLAGGTAVNTNTLLLPNTTLVWDRWVTAGAITAIAATGTTNLSVTETV